MRIYKHTDGLGEKGVYWECLFDVLDDHITMWSKIGGSVRFVLTKGCIDTVKTGRIDRHGN